jgi:hypothetical protein
MRHLTNATCLTNSKFPSQSADCEMSGSTEYQDEQFLHVHRVGGGGGGKGRRSFSFGRAPMAEVTSDITRNVWKLRAVVSHGYFEVASGFRFIIVYY